MSQTTLKFAPSKKRNHSKISGSEKETIDSSNKKLKTEENQENKTVLQKLLLTTDFNKIADSLLNKYKLILKNGKEYRICEIEFYLKSKEHPDTFTHCNPV